jgi:hypothetical protein
MNWIELYCKLRIIGAILSVLAIIIIIIYMIITKKKPF